MDNEAKLHELFERYDKKVVQEKEFERFQNSTDDERSASPMTRPTIRDENRLKKWMTMRKKFEHALSRSTSKKSSAPNESRARNLILKDKKFSKRIYKGIPNQMRAFWWAVLLNLNVNDNEFANRLKNYYEECLSKARHHGRFETINQIDLDIERTFNTEKGFLYRHSLNQQELFYALAAFAEHNREIAYCQGMSELAGLLLLYLRPDYNVFGALINLMMKPPWTCSGFFTENFPRLKLFSDAFDQILRIKLPRLHRHLADEQIVPGMYCPEWFLRCFINCFPTELYLRIWDIFLLEGDPIKLAVAYTIMKIFRVQLMRMRMEQILMFLKSELIGALPANHDTTIACVSLCMKELRNSKRLFSVVKRHDSASASSSASSSAGGVAGVGGSSASNSNASSLLANQEGAAAAASFFFQSSSGDAPSSLPHAHKHAHPHANSTSSASSSNRTDDEENCDEEGEGEDADDWMRRAEREELQSNATSTCSDVAPADFASLTPSRSSQAYKHAHANTVSSVASNSSGLAVSALVMSSHPISNIPASLQQVESEQLANQTQQQEEEKKEKEEEEEKKEKEEEKVAVFRQIPTGLANSPVDPQTVSIATHTPHPHQANQNEVEEEALSNQKHHKRETEAPNSLDFASRKNTLTNLNATITPTNQNAVSIAQHSYDATHEGKAETATANHSSPSNVEEDEDQNQPITTDDNSLLIGGGGDGGGDEEDSNERSSHWTSCFLENCDLSAQLGDNLQTSHF